MEGSSRRLLRVTFCGIAAMAVLAAAPDSCLAQSAEKIIDQSLRAAGGVKVIGKIHSAAWEGTVKDANGTGTGEFTLMTAVPDQFYREFVFGAEQIAEACNISSCWAEEGSGNLYTLFGAEEKRAEATGRYLNFALANYKKLKIRVRLIGADTVKAGPPTSWR